MIRHITALLFLVCLVPALMLGATNGKKYQDPVTANPDTSAPDAWGYTYVRSTDLGGPTFHWVDITTRGTLVAGLADDNYVGPFPIQFAFPYYWYTVSSFYIGSNGYVNFSSPANFASPFFALPNTGATVPKDLLAVLAGDLDFTYTQTNPRCYYWTNGTDSLVVSFINVNEWRPAPSAPSYRHTFQIVLNKADSSITYQYGLRQGLFNDATNNYSLCMGWQNVTGQIGTSYYYGTTPPHAGLPDSGFAIKIKRTVVTPLQVTDAGIVGGFDAGGLAKMFKTGVADTVKCVVKNFGTTAITNAPVRYAITRSGQPSAFDTVIVSALAQGQQVTVTFPRIFTPAVAGPYSALFNVTVAGDANPGNNSKTAELTSVAFGQIGQTTQLAYETGTQSGSISWTGGGGFGIAIDLPSFIYPVKVESVYVDLSAVTAGQPMTVSILDGSSGAPGAVLAQRIVTTPTVGWNNINFTTDAARVAGGRFFVGASGQVTFYYELTVPISGRTWEFTNGWAPYRSGDVQDIHVRAVVRREPLANYNWTSQTSGITTYLYSVRAIDAQTAWAAGAGGVVRRTTNGGTTWTGVGGGHIGTADIYNIDAVDANTAFVTTSPAATYIFRTTNGGALWDTVFTQAGGFIDGIKMFDATNGVALGDPVGGKWTLARTINGGATWTLDTAHAPLQIGTEAGTQNCLTAVGSNYIWFSSTAGGRIYKSTDGGNTWSTGITPFAAPSNVWFNNASYGIATSSANFVARSVDGGNTWTTVTPAGTGFLIACGGFGSNDLFYARGTTIYRSPDAGQTFGTSYVGTGSYVGLSFVKQGQVASGWAVTSTGGIAAFSTQLVDVREDNPSGVPTAFTLMQNYPNPFNPTTTIRYTLPQSAQVSVRVYNILGQEVAQLNNELQTAGVHETVWSGRNTSGQIVASGVYFYRLEAKALDGKTAFNDFKKMLLLK